jgi:hypothetical protein
MNLPSASFAERQRQKLPFETNADYFVTLFIAPFQFDKTEKPWRVTQFA